jgi:hypothetical protein
MNKALLLFLAFSAFFAPQLYANGNKNREPDPDSFDAWQRRMNTIRPEGRVGLVGNGPIVVFAGTKGRVWKLNTNADDILDNTGKTITVEGITRSHNYVLEDGNTMLLEHIEDVLVISETPAASPQNDPEPMPVIRENGLIQVEGKLHFIAHDPYPVMIVIDTNGDCWYVEQSNKTWPFNRRHNTWLVTIEGLPEYQDFILPNGNRVILRSVKNIRKIKSSPSLYPIDILL